jgi:hypothetical protein
MSFKTLKTIYLVDNCTSGHHHSYVVTFCKELLKLDTKIVLLYPNSKQVKNELATLNPLAKDRLVCVPFHNIGIIQKKGFVRISNLLQWAWLGLNIRLINLLTGSKPDLIFFAYIDSYLTFLKEKRLVELLVPQKWTGLYFHPIHIRQNTSLSEVATVDDNDFLLTTKNCIGTCLLDENIAEIISTRTGKDTFVFPDFADNSLSYNQSIVEIKEKAKNRTIVGMIGMDKRKGILDFVRIAKKASPDEFFFVLAGKLYLNGFDETEQIEIKQFMENPNEHMYVKVGFIETEAEYNSYLNSVDILYVVYSEFYGSSNTLTKAAIFNKKILATDEHLIGERVRKYKLGITTRPNNPDQILKDLIELKNTPIDTEMREEYKRVHSIERLSFVLNSILEKV